ncbi:MAG: gliding motility-associated C-terminal domain-containing protein [bacterium]
MKYNTVQLKRLAISPALGLLFAAGMTLFLAKTAVSEEQASKQSNAAATVWIDDSQTQLVEGTQFDVNILIGTELAPVTGLFGLSFELHYSDDKYFEFIDPVEAVSGAFLEPDTYTFTRHEPENKVFFLAVSRKRGAAGQSGYGLVLSLTIQLKQDVPVGWQTCFEITNVSANDSVGASIAVEAGSEVCFNAEEPAIEVIPNPFTPNGDGSNDAVEFKREGGIPEDWTILIMDRAGRIIRRLTGGQDFWDGHDQQGRLMLPGTYLYTVNDHSRLAKRGLLWLIL